MRAIGIDSYKLSRQSHKANKSDCRTRRSRGEGDCILRRWRLDGAYANRSARCGSVHLRMLLLSKTGSVSFELSDHQRPTVRTADETTHTDPSRSGNAETQASYS